MGEVWLAEQLSPVRRKVALKVIKAGMDTQRGGRPVRVRAPGAGDDGPPGHRPGLRRRQHPGGPPYFVMEYVPGLPITDYCDTHRLLHRASASSCSPRSATASSTPIRRRSSTATSSRRTSWSPMRREAACRRSSTSGSPRPSAAAHRPDAAHRDRRRDRHARVHEPGAGRRHRARTSTPGPTSIRSASSSTSCSPGCCRSPPRSCGPRAWRSCGGGSARTILEAQHTCEHAGGGARRGSERAGPTPPGAGRWRPTWTPSPSRRWRRTGNAAMARRRSSPTTSADISGASRWSPVPRAVRTGPSVTSSGTASGSGWPRGWRYSYRLRRVDGSSGTADRDGAGPCEPGSGGGGSRLPDFLIRMFRVSDPGEARGNSITARGDPRPGVEGHRPGNGEGPRAPGQDVTRIAEVTPTSGYSSRLEPSRQRARHRTSSPWSGSCRDAPGGRSTDHHPRVDGSVSGGEVLALDTVERKRRVFGPDDDRTLSVMNSLGLLYLFQGKLDCAERVLGDVLESGGGSLARTDGHAGGRQNLSEVYLRQDRPGPGRAPPHRHPRTKATGVRA